MAKIAYQSTKLGADRLALIDKCNDIIAEYQADGLLLTLRQLYYQLVSRDIIANKTTEYKRLGDVVNSARLCGLMDWSAIEDRTRELVVSAHWDGPEDILSACASQFRVDRWANQDVHVECFPPETLVQTPSGYMAIGAIQVGDQVMTGKGRPRSVERVFRKPYVGDMVHVDAAGLLSFMCTPEHPLWAQTPDPKLLGYKGALRKFAPPAYLPAEELTRFSLLRIPLLKETVAVPSVRFPASSRSFDPGIVPVTDEFLTVIGFYLAEGCVKGDGRTVQFTFAEDETNFAATVSSWATSVGFNPFTRAGKGTCIVYVCGKALATWLTANFGSGSRNKRLPKWCTTL